MKTKLPESINSLEEAKSFLHELHQNGEDYHPEDDAYDIIWDLPDDESPTYEEKAKLNELMEQCYQFTGELVDGDYTDFDPCEYLMELEQS